MGANVPDKQFDELTRADCLNRLGKHHLGRLAFIDKVGVMPLIMPVNYLLDHDTVVFRTDAGSKLDAAIRGAPVAFEVDEVDEQRRTGWSVVVSGHAEEVTDPSELARLRDSPLVPWAPGPKANYVRVRPGPITGRRISLADLPSSWWG
jgi:nitroimidazol reductase NimA-like FMN-containing flavoprotein (pyridoxamine 5'-phosphate oxidase superfamily)